MRGTDRSMMGRSDKKYGTLDYVRELQRERGLIMVIMNFIYRTKFPFMRIISYWFRNVICVYILYE